MNLAEQYIQQVITGEVLVNEYVRLTVERHLNDLEVQEQKGWFFDREEAERVLSFFSLLKHTKGAYANRNFGLQGWQAFILYCIFGWKLKSGYRRFAKAYIEIARKNGKTELAAGIAVLLLIADGEFGAEVYFAATKKDQARIGFDAAKIMCKMLKKDSRSINKLVGIYRHNIHIVSLESKCEALGADSDTLDGLNPSGAVVDEYHAHKTSEVLEVIETGMGARKQPLLFIISTAGFNKESPCFHLRRNAIEVLKGIKTDDRFFPMIFCLDESDEWQDEKNWGKANPNLGVSVQYDFLRNQYQQAINQGYTKQVQFLTKNLNKWTSVSATWITDDDWKKCGQDYDLEALKGRRCYGGLDLASVRDIAALVLLFPPIEPNERLKILSWFWCPEDGIQKRSLTDGVDYKKWESEGHIFATDGNATDYGYIENKIYELAEYFDLQSIAYDTWNSSQLVINLSMNEIEMSPMRQGFKTLSYPTKELERLVANEGIAHNGDPVMRWMISNIEISIDPAENIKIDKKKSSEKVDGPVALVMAIGEYIDQENDPDNRPSKYETEDLLIV